MLARLTRNDLITLTHNMIRYNNPFSKHYGQCQVMLKFMQPMTVNSSDYCNNNTHQIKPSEMSNSRDVIDSDYDSESDVNDVCDCGGGVCVHTSRCVQHHTITSSDNDDNQTNNIITTPTSLPVNVNMDVNSSEY